MSILAILIFLAPPNFALAQNSKSADALTVEILLVGGNKKTLSAPFNLNARFEATDFTITWLSIGGISSLVLDETGREKNIFLLTPAGINEPIHVKVSDQAKVSGSGEWGREIIALSKIQSLTVLSPKAPPPFEPAKNKWSCSFISGKSFFIDWSNDSEGKIGNASLYLGLARLAEIVRDGQNWTLSCADRSTVQGWRPKHSSFSAQSPYGSIEVPWANIAKLSKQQAPAGDSKNKDAEPKVWDWRIEIAGRILLPITDIQPGSNTTWDDDLDIRKLKWDFIDSGVTKPGSLELHLINQKTGVLKGSLTGVTPFGKLVADCKDITKLEKFKPLPKKQTSTKQDKKIIATVTTSSGNIYPVVTSSLEGGNEVVTNSGFFGYGMLRVQTPPIEIWLPSEHLLRSGLTAVDGKLVSSEQYGKLEGIAGIKFANPTGEFFLSVKKLVRYAPQAFASHSKSHGTVQTGKYRIVVRNAAGKEFAGKVGDIEFARYPSLGWSGMYSTWDYPFQWHRADKLFFKNESGDRMDVEFAKLRKIEIPGSYDSSRRAVLTSTQGTQIKGFIYPGDVATSYPGISDWDPDKEGLLTRTTDGTYLYIPFSKETIIEIQHTVSR